MPQSLWSVPVNPCRLGSLLYIKVSVGLTRVTQEEGQTCMQKASALAWDGSQKGESCVHQLEFTI